MAIPLKYNTASQEFTFGQALDNTDGDTEEGGLTIANTDIKLHKAGTIILASKNSGGATYISNGVYYGTFDATDTNTYGPMTMYIHVSGALAMKVEFEVMNAVAYDALYGTDNFDVNVTQLGGVTQSADDLKDFADAGYDPATNKVQGVVLVDTSTDLTNLPSIPANWLTATGINAGAFTAGKFAASSLNGKGDWNIGKTGYTLTVTPPTAIENADAYLDRDMSIGTDSGSSTVRTPRQALRFLRNKWSITGTTLTVTKEDDSTSAWTATVSTDAAAEPVTGNNPTGGA